MGRLKTDEEICEKYKDILGLKRGIRTIIDFTTERAKDGSIQCLVKCECGKVDIMPIYRFVNNDTYSCGCVNIYTKETLIKKYGYLIGTTINKWNVIGITGEKNKNGEYTATCKCSCKSETIKEVPIHWLVHKTAVSCGCAGTCAKLTHGDTKTRLHNIWCDMRKRCRQNKGKNFKHYKSKGIKVCKEWENSYESFKEWSLENGYNDSLTIDRIDVNGDYCRENCRWVNWEAQQNNRGNNKYYIVKGEKKTISELSREYGMTYEIIRGR